jgi:hypothetical protein
VTDKTQQLVVVIDNQSMLVYDRSKPLPEHQQRFLNNMDVQMDSGITIDGHQVVSPDLPSRAQFVALNLVRAIIDHDEQKAAAMCSYLALRLPDLKQVQAISRDGAFGIDLVFDREYRPETTIQFTKPNTH